MKFKTGCVTDIGKVKANNEDSFYHCERQGFFLVADGMGGHAGGEVASRMAVEIMKSAFDEAFQNSRLPEDIPGFIENAIITSSEAIKKETLENPTLRGMGTTVVSCFCSGGKIYVANVGDSRCYRLSGEAFELISHDHSQVQEYIDMGLITEEAAKKHPLRHVITQAVGYNDELKVRIVEEPYRAGDYYLLCSDGLNDHFSTDGEIKDLFIKSLAESGDDVQAACSKLVEVSNELGGRDNITVMVFKVIE